MGLDRETKAVGGLPRVRPDRDDLAVMRPDVAVCRCIALFGEEILADCGDGIAAQVERLR